MEFDREKVIVREGNLVKIEGCSDADLQRLLGGRDTGVLMTVDGISYLVADTDLNEFAHDSDDIPEIYRVEKPGVDEYVDNAILGRVSDPQEARNIAAMFIERDDVFAGLYAEVAADESFEDSLYGALR